MTSLGNFVLGAVLAGVLLAPGASADANRLLSGRPLESALLTATGDKTVALAGGAMQAAYGALPRLWSEALAQVAAAMAEAR